MSDPYRGLAEWILRETPEFEDPTWPSTLEARLRSSLPTVSSTSHEIRELAEGIASIMLPDSWEEGAMTPEDAGRFVASEVESRLRSSLPAVSSLLGEVAGLRGALETIAHGAPTGHPYATPEETLAEKVQVAEEALLLESGKVAGDAVRAAVRVRLLRRQWNDKIVLTDEEHEAGYGRAVGDLDTSVDALLAAHPEIRGEVEDG